MSERISHATMAEELARLVGAKAKWLADFSSGPKRRPDWNIQITKRELRVLEQAQSDYRKAAERDSKKEDKAA